MYRIFVFISFLILPDFCQADEWRLKKRVYRGESPTVGDLFTVRSDNEQKTTSDILPNKLNLSGQSRWYDAAQLLDEQLGHSSGVQGKVWIELCHQVNTTEFVNQIVKDINRQLSNEFVRVSHVALRGERQICVKDTLKNFDFELINPDYLSANMRVSIRQENKEISQLMVEPRIEIFSPVVSARISRGKEVDFSTLTFDWQKVNAVSLSQVVKDTNLKAKAKTDIARGGLITLRNVQPISLVEQGAQVSILLVDKALRIESQGRALKSGNEGDTISVLVDDASQPVHGLIDKEGKIHVEML